MFASLIITKSNFNEICRTCLESKNNLSNINSEVLNMLECCTTIKILSTDNLPNHICEVCLNKITNSFVFKQQCENADRILHQINETDNKEWFNTDIKENICTEIDISYFKIENNDVIFKSESLLEEKVNSDSNDDSFSLDISKNSAIDGDKKYGSNRLRKNSGVILNKEEKLAKYSCENCSKQFNKISELGKHANKKHKTEPVSCTICKKLFTVQLQLDLHLKTHKIEKKLNCNQCGEKFQWPSLLKRHLLKHTKGNDYPCTQCDKIFKNEVYLNYHQRRVHLGERNLVVCTICGKSVARLKDHLTTHSSEKPFKCNQCPKEFSNKKYLSLHKQRKHVVLEEAKRRPYLCSICGKGSLTTTALKKHHELMHTVGKPYPCPICNKKFKNDKNVNVHIRYTHNDERRYSCTLCPKKLRTSTKLKIHMRVHTGERPYVCKICSKAFSQINTLNTHMKVHGINYEKSNRNIIKDCSSKL